MARRPSPHYGVPADPDEDLRDGVLTLAEAARFVAHGRNWLYRRLAAGEIRSFVLGGKRVVPRRALVEFLGRARCDSEAGGR